MPVEKQCAVLPMPEFPALRKNYSSENRARAHDFGVRMVESLPVNNAVRYTDGGRSEDSHHVSGVVGLGVDGTKFQIKFRLRGRALSSHIAELYAIRAAVLWAIKFDVPTCIVSDSASAVKSITDTRPAACSSANRSGV